MMFKLGIVNKSHFNVFICRVMLQVQFLIINLSLNLQ